MVEKTENQRASQMIRENMYLEADMKYTYAARLYKLHERGLGSRVQGFTLHEVAAEDHATHAVFRLVMEIISGLATSPLYKFQFIVVF